MYSFFLGRFRHRVSVWEGLCAPTLAPRLRTVGPALAPGPEPATVAAVCDRRPNHGGHRPPLQLSCGFTLLELLVVIGVIAVLTGIVLGVGRHAAESGKTARARAELAALSAALDSYKLAQGDYPRTNEPARLLQSLIGKRGPDYQLVNGPVLIEADRFTFGGALDPFTSETAQLLDPWGQPYRYAYKTQTLWTNPSFVLYSVGLDASDTAALLPGGFPDAKAPGNADNLNANQP